MMSRSCATASRKTSSQNWIWSHNGDRSFSDERTHTDHQTTHTHGYLAALTLLTELSTLVVNNSVAIWRHFCLHGPIRQRRLWERLFKRRFINGLTYLLTYLLTTILQLHGAVWYIWILIHSGPKLYLSLGATRPRLVAVPEKLRFLCHSTF